MVSGNSLIAVFEKVSSATFYYSTLDLHDDTADFNVVFRAPTISTVSLVTKHGLLSLKTTITRCKKNRMQLPFSIIKPYAVAFSYHKTVCSCLFLS